MERSEAFYIVVGRLIGLVIGLIAGIVILYR